MSLESQRLIVEHDHDHRQLEAERSLQVADVIAEPPIPDDANDLLVGYRQLGPQRSGKAQPSEPSARKKCRPASFTSTSAPAHAAA